MKQILNVFLYKKHLIGAIKTWSCNVFNIHVSNANSAVSLAALYANLAYSAARLAGLLALVI